MFILRWKKKSFLCCENQNRMARLKKKTVWGKLSFFFGTVHKTGCLSWLTSSPLHKTVNVGLRFDLFLHKQLTRLHLSSAIFNMLDEETCAHWEGLKQQKYESGRCSDEQMSGRSTSRPLVEWSGYIFPQFPSQSASCSASKEKMKKRLSYCSPLVTHQGVWLETHNPRLKL